MDKEKYSYIDLFSGCGGLSLGLTMANLQGKFAIEKDSMAFETFSANFLSDRKLPIEKFQWPEWLEQRAWGIDELLAKHLGELKGLAKQIDILAGGPPCQGFSFAGRRNGDDPRNQLFTKYVEVVDAVRPKILVLENVPGMRIAHWAQEGKDGSKVKHSESYYEKLRLSLEAIGYEVHGEILDAARFGVPQRRARLIAVGVRSDVSGCLNGGKKRFFSLIEEIREQQLKDLKLGRTVSAHEAIDDLRTRRRWSKLKECTDPRSKSGFQEVVYTGPDSSYQRLMHRFCRSDAMDSMRLANHSIEVAGRFERIIEECRKGVRMDEDSRKKFRLKKHRIFPMSGNEPAPTITTLPDDVLHYAEPRILTVRESARLQSFPDWFRFKGKFTTGGASRTKECPRYTQVGNAVPPLLARAIGLAIKQILDEIHGRS
ncbi:DNA cytosine methyltransferase [Bordetella petrii]|uniref:DNA cytosine methyltransferase n=1 Tax=Bordetella petrii TaxID=94624 RepID=UPI001A95B992|nr:DNA cytosine methyltransferase [Bordetella petrii]MBO1111842.1 DNA cytosine methyltransferase [Bordetella petrii]